MSKPACYRCPDHGRVAVSEATLARLKAHAQSQGMSMGAVIEALTQDLEGAQ